MSLVAWVKLHPNANLGYLPQWLDTNDPDPAHKQIDKHYIFGGWQSSSTKRQMTLTEDNVMHYPGDPPQHPIAFTVLRNEMVLLYRGDWVIIRQPGDAHNKATWDVARID